MFDLSFKDILALIPSFVYKRLALILTFQVAGLFIGVLLAVLVLGNNCPVCNTKYKWYKKIPILPFIFFFAKCKNCKKRMSVIYLLFPIFTSLSWGLAVRMFWSKSIVYTVAVLILISVCLCIFFNGIKAKPNDRRYLFALILPAVITAFFDVDIEVSLLFHFLALFMAFLLFLNISLISGKIKKINKVNFYDPIFAGIIGFSLGWEKFLFSLTFTVVCIIIALPIIKFKKSCKSLSYGITPFLSIGYIVSLLFGTDIIEYCIERLI